MMKLPLPRHKNIAAFVPFVQFVNFLVVLLAIAIYGNAVSACLPFSEFLRGFAYRRTIAMCTGGILFNTAVAVSILILPNISAFFGIARSSSAKISRLGLIPNTLVLIPVGAFIITATVGDLANGDAILARDALLLAVTIFIYLPNALLLRDRLLHTQADAENSTRHREQGDQAIPLPAAPITPPMLGLTITGRIGRLRYLAHLLPAIFLQVFTYVIATLFGSEHPVFMVVCVWPLLALNAWVAIRPMVLRLHDVNRSGKWTIAIFVLAVLSVTAKSQASATFCTTLLALYLVAFASVLGTAGNNRYGPAGAPRQ